MLLRAAPICYHCMNAGRTFVMHTDIELSSSGIAHLNISPVPDAQTSGARLNIKTVFSCMGIFHFKDKTVDRLIFINGNPYIGKTLYRKGTSVSCVSSLYGHFTPDKPKITLKMSCTFPPMYQSFPLLAGCLAREVEHLCAEKPQNKCWETIDLNPCIKTISKAGRPAHHKKANLVRV